MKYQLLPDLGTSEYEALREDIRRRGVLVPVELDENGEILDGHNRAAIAAELGIDYPTVVRAGLTEDDKYQHVLALNLARRHLSREQRIELHTTLRARGLSFPTIARMTGYGVGTVHRDTTFPNGKVVHGADLLDGLTEADREALEMTGQLDTIVSFRAELAALEVRLRYANTPERAQKVAEDGERLGLTISAWVAGVKRIRDELFAEDEADRARRREAGLPPP